MKTKSLAALACLALLVPVGLSTAAPPTPKKVDPAPKVTVDYDRDIKPLLAAKCGACHGNGSRLGGFQIDSRAALLKGGETGPAVVPGKSKGSLLIQMVSGEIPGRVMPAKGPRLAPKEVALLKAWVDGGASFGKDAVTAAPWSAPLAPREPALPPIAPGSGVTNPIDRLLQSYYKANKVVPKALVEDRVYARRVSLDVIGLLPDPEDLDAFVADKSPDKREKLAKSLLAENDRYAEHWLTFWNDLLRNDYAGTGYIDGGRTQITQWLYSSLAENKPYDRFVAELINPRPESAGFVKGIVWRGVVNASQTPEMQAAQNISQVFMGVNLKCASCHNSFVSTWKLADAYGMASIFAPADKGSLEMVRCDRPTGEAASAKFLYPELGAIDPNAPRDVRLARLAEVVTSRTNGRLARTFVNRIWARLMGRGLIEPVDEMDNRPWSPDVLDWLAADFAKNNYDVRHLIERIVTSRAYQMASMPQVSENNASFVFRGPVVKRMGAEQFVDAVSTLTGVWSRPAMLMRIGKDGKPILPGSKGRAQFVFQTEMMKSGSVPIDVDVTGAEFLSLIVTDAGDGGSYDWADWGDPVIVTPQGDVHLTDLTWHSASTGYGKIQLGKSVVEKPIRLGDKTFANGIGAHANSIITYLLPPGTTRFRAVAGPDTGGVEEGQGKASIRIFVATGKRSVIDSRAALAVADPLTRALGRPNREQVVTQRSPVATTLQALELTNGETLAAMLHKGADHWKTDPKAADAGTLVDDIYHQALGRKPMPNEREAAVELIGTPVTKEGVEDLLWAIIQLPEFQLIY